MNAKEILEHAIQGARDGVDACYQRPNAVTVNHAVANILTQLERAMVFALDEIEKGNAK